MKEGKWIRFEGVIPIRGFPKLYYHCDQCGHVEDHKPLFCKKCGAKMDIKTEEER